MAPLSQKAERAAAVAKLTLEQEALYALRWNVARSDLPAAAQLEYDRLKAEGEREAAATRGPLRCQRPGRSFRPLAGTGLRGRR